MTDAVAVSPDPATDPTPAFDPAVGAAVYVLFWRGNVMPGGKDAGQWDTLTGRVVAAGPARVAYAPTNPHLPDHWGNEDAWLSGPAPAVRFAARDRCFASDEAAKKFAESLPPG